MTPRRMVWLGYAGIVLTIVWGVGIIPALMVISAARKFPIAADTPSHQRRDVRGGLLLARIAAVLNSIALAFIAWMLISTYVV